jgi:hypothetical protein
MYKNRIPCYSHNSLHMLPEQPTFHYMVNCTNPRLEDLIAIYKRVLIARYTDEQYKSIGEVLKKRSK